MPLFFLSNALFPIDKMPGWLRAVSVFNPISYAVDGLRGLLINASQFGIMFDFGVSIAALIISITVATYLFSKTSI
jgi:ABC-2 type transport system permease protein